MDHQMRAFHLTSWAEAFLRICFSEHLAFFFHLRLHLHPRRCSGLLMILRLQSNYHWNHIRLKRLHMLMKLLRLGVGSNFRRINTLVFV